MYISKTTNRIQIAAQTGRGVLRVKVRQVQSEVTTLSVYLTVLLCARGPLARVKKLCKSPAGLLV